SASHLMVWPDDGKVMALVESGPFLAGADRRPAWEQGFYLDLHPVTNAEYARFAAVTGQRTPAHWPNGRCPESLLNHPVVGVDAHDADRYAEWAGKRLPTGPQWEKAARGVDGAVLPWGTAADGPARCNVRESGVGTTTPVDRYPDGVSPWGVYDLCGNVWEWCATVTAPGRRELKGGAYSTPLARATPSGFTDARFDASRRDVGFRCAVGVAEVVAMLSV
ncbi:MAG TPA: SUMF1/EgtB/PvdO family nonheme iron enzyme, partial [Micromonosporaceae bacterium]